MAISMGSFAPVGITGCRTRNCFSTPGRRPPNVGVGGSVDARCSRRRNRVVIQAEDAPASEPVDTAACREGCADPGAVGAG
jgi:hypothetical protein